MLVIETLIDFEALSIEEVTQRIKSVQDREEAPHAEPSTARGKLLYTTEQWRAFDKKKMDEASGSGPPRECRCRPRGGKKKEEKGPWVQAGADGGAIVEHKATWDDTCLNYDRTCHWAKDCRLPPRRGREAHVAQVEAQDHALFLVHECVELWQETGEEEKDSSFPLPSSIGSALIHLDEPRAHAFLGTSNGDDKIGG